MEAARPAGLDVRVVEQTDGSWWVYIIDPTDEQITVEKLIGQVTRNARGLFGAHLVERKKGGAEPLLFGGATGAFDRLVDAARLVLAASAARDWPAWLVQPGVEIEVVEPTGQGGV